MKQSRLSLLVIVGAFGLLLGTESEAARIRGKSDFSPFANKSICGEYDLQPVNQYNEVNGIPVERVATNSMWAGKFARSGSPGTMGCTGTLVGPDLFLAAGHCGAGYEGEVTFDYVDGATDLKYYQVQEVVKRVEEYNEQNPIGIDFTLYRLKEPAGLERGWVSVSVEPLQKGDVVFIIQHPNSETKKVGAGQVTDLNNREINHNVDTANASSGSGVLNARGELIAVHTNGGCGAGTSYKDSNGGTLLSAIFENSPEIKELFANLPPRPEVMAPR